MRGLYGIDPVVISGRGMGKGLKNKECYRLQQ